MHMILTKEKYWKLPTRETVLNLVWALEFGLPNEDVLHNRQAQELIWDSVTTNHDFT